MAALEKQCLSTWIRLRPWWHGMRGQGAFLSCNSKAANSSLSSSRNISSQKWPQGAVSRHAAENHGWQLKGFTNASTGCQTKSAWGAVEVCYLLKCIFFVSKSLATFGRCFLAKKQIKLLPTQTLIDIFEIKSKQSAIDFLFLLSFFFFTLE